VQVQPGESGDIVKSESAVDHLHKLRRARSAMVMKSPLSRLALVPMMMQLEEMRK
jgi:hypothetical protein